MNLRELSQLLGLSQTTVSRALNGYPEVNEETRRRVLEVAEQHHYSPNASARRLATGRTGAIGIVFPAGDNPLLDPLFIDFLVGITHEAGRNKIDVLVNATLDDDNETYRRLARAKSVDCIVLSSPHIDDQRPGILARLGLPYIIHGRTRGCESMAYLDIDNEGAFRRATDLMIGFGHQRIAYVNGLPHLRFAQDRMEGWRSAHLAAGLTPDPTLVCGAPMTEESGYHQTRALLDLPNPPTAILCSSMFIALGCYRAVRDAGLTVGVDVSVIAHDDGSPSIRPESLQPPVTTTYSSIRSAGKRITEIALELASGAPPESMQEVWPVDLIFRDSVTRPLKT